MSSDTPGIKFCNLVALNPEIIVELDTFLSEVASCFSMFVVADTLDKPVSEVAQLIKNSDSTVMDMYMNPGEYQVDYTAFNNDKGDVVDLVMGFLLTKPVSVIAGALARLMFTHLVNTGDLLVNEYQEPEYDSSEVIFDSSNFEVLNLSDLEIKNFIYQGEDKDENNN